MYLDSVVFKEDVRCFERGDEFTFCELNLFVGDQGCGKSTLLEYIAHQDSAIDIKLTPKGLAGVETRYFDTEKMNPRMKNPVEYTNINGTDKGIGFAGAIYTRFKSHGEVLVKCSLHIL